MDILTYALCKNGGGGGGGGSSSAWKGVMAPAYDESGVYNAGEYVIKDNVLYRC